MSRSPSTAVRVDRAVGRVLDGESTGAATAAAGLTTAEREIVEVAALVRAALPAPPVGPRFEARLGARLSGALPARDAVGWALRHPGRLIVTGAVGSAVGVGVTAYAVWRNGRRAPSPAHRLLHR